MAASLTPAAADLNRWEVGAGIGALRIPHYIGASESHEFVLPTPYFRYESDVLRADRSGVRFVFHETDRLAITLSASGSLPAADNEAREGMDDLDLIAEIGPALQYAVFRDRHSVIRLDLQLRGAFSLGEEVRHRGLTSNPRLYWSTISGGWKSTATLGVLLGDTRYHDYFYSVDDRFATAARPAYQASGGVTAARISFTLSRRFGDWFAGGAFNYYDLDGASNELSPLVRETNNFAAGVVLAWVFAESR